MSRSSRALFTCWPERARPAGLRRRRRWSCWFAGALLIASGAGASAAAPATAALAMGAYTGQRLTLLAVDDHALPLRGELCLYLSKPDVRAKPVLTPSRDNPQATDGVATHFYGSVLRDGGKFRMWYYGVGWAGVPTEKDLDTKKLKEGPVCYAESVDGLHWTKPVLGQVVHGGGSNNNAIALPDTETQGAFVLRDDQDPDPNRRYKMVYENRHVSLQFMSVRTATSPDGIRWTPGPNSPINSGLEPSAFYQHGGLFFINAQYTRAASEGGHRAGRQGYVWVSTDFNTWLQEAGESFLLPESADPNERGLDRPGLQVHLGVGAFSQGNVLVGLYSQWNSQPRPGDRFGRGTTTGDFGLVVSSDGQHFREPVKGHVYLSRSASPAAVTPGVRHQMILQQSGNGILNVGNETWIYHGRWVNPENLEHYHAEIALATLPRDRWGALGLYPRAKEGTVWSAPITIGRAGARVTLNAEGVRGLSVEIADANFRLLPQYSGEQSGRTTAADGLDCAVTWEQGSLDSLVGRSVRFRVRLQRGEEIDPRLFALYVTSE
jgi:hypothetical protein